MLTSCEQGSEGWSGWDYHSVALGDTDEEIYNSWVENVKEIEILRGRICIIFIVPIVVKKTK